MPDRNLTISTRRGGGGGGGGAFLPAWLNIFQGACRQARHQRVGQEVGHQTVGLRGPRGITLGVDWGQHWSQKLTWP